MWTTIFVVAIRPLQLLLACAALITASLDQLYLDNQLRLYILIGLILPSTLGVIAASVHTSLIYKQRHEMKRIVMLLRAVADFIIAVLMTGAIVLVFLVNSKGMGYRTEPPVPFLVIFIVCLCVNVSLFLASAIVLVLEMCMSRRRPRYPAIIAPYESFDTYGSRKGSASPLMEPRKGSGPPIIIHTSHDNASPMALYAKPSNDSLFREYSHGHPYDNPYRWHAR